MNMGLFDGSQTPELNDATLQLLLKRIEEERQKRISEARGRATIQGLGLGSTFEGQGIGFANQAATEAGNSAAIDISTKAAEAARQDRLAKEAQAYQAAEAEKQRQASIAEAERSRVFDARQAELNRLFQGDQSALARSSEEAAARRASKDNLLGSALGAGGSVLGGMFRQGVGGLFGGTPAAAGANATTTGIAGSMGLPAGGVGTMPMGIGSKLFTPGALGLAGTAAGLFGGGYAGQSLAKLTGKNTREAKAGSAVGAGLGTLFGGPLGGVVGGAAGGLLTKGVQGISKKLFCFDPTTMIEMADGSEKPIAQVELGDETKGGVVLSIRRSLTEEGTRFYYKGVIVTGSHAVLEGKRWTRVQNSEWAQPLEGAGIVISIVTDNHRVFTNGIEMADEAETDFYEDLSIEESLEALNAEQEEVSNG